MGYSYAVVFNKDNRRNKSGTYSLLIRVTVNRRSRYLRIGERLEEKYWAGKENRWIKDSHPCSFELNQIIKKKLHHLEKYIYRQKLYDNQITLNGISEYYTKTDDPDSFTEYVDEFMRRVRGKSLNTLKKYRTFVAYLNEYKSQIAFSELNEKFFQAFASWLERKGMMGVTVYKYFDPFKVMVKEAVKSGYLEKNPFEYVSLGVKPTKGKRVYLELIEITAIRNAPIPKDRPDLVEIRDYWLFCFYASFYYSDLRKLQWADVKSTDHGYCLVGERFKNENGFIAPIHKFLNAIRLLEKQKGKDPNLVFPNTISEQKFNDKLKELAKIAKINKKLMNKTARHSSIQFWEAQGLETQHMAKIAGHTQESTTKEYYDLSPRDINSRVARFDFTALDI